MPLAENMSSILVRTWAGGRCIVPNVPVVTLVILEPLGFVGSACFSFVRLLPPGATWTRPRQPFMAEDRQELPDLDTDELAKAARPDRPFELMALLEFKWLGGPHTARRRAASAAAEYRRPLGVSNLKGLTTSIHLGWPDLATINDDLVYLGHLPKRCGCSMIHRPMKEQADGQHFNSASSPSLGRLFWFRCLLQVQVPTIFDASFFQRRPHWWCHRQAVAGRKADEAGTSGLCGLVTD